MPKKTEENDDIQTVSQSVLPRKECRKNWARLIQKKYEIAPLICPKCQGEMRIITFIEIPHIIKKILKHLDLWETNNHDPPKIIAVPTQASYDDAYSATLHCVSQIPQYDYWIQ